MAGDPTHRDQRGVNSVKNTVVPLAVAAFLLPAALHAADYIEKNAPDGGTIVGRVKFTGEDQPPVVYSVTKDNAVCGTDERRIDYVRVENGHLLDTIVYLDKVSEGKAFPEELGEAVIEHRECDFTPFIQIMRNRRELASVNTDPLLHNFHTYELLRGSMAGPRKTVTNVTQPEQGEIKARINLRRGPALKVECDAHDFMHSFVFVANNPYFARVTEEGRFRIDGIPPGSYTIKAWHGVLKNQHAKVEVEADATATVDFTFN